MTEIMTREHAQALVTARDTDTRLLSRKSKHELVVIAGSEGRGWGYATWSKDELVAAILSYRGFGIERLNEAIHVLHHEPGTVGSTACGWCVCQVTWTAPSALAPGQDQLVQCEGAPGHDGTHHAAGRFFYAATA